MANYALTAVATAAAGQATLGYNAQSTTPRRTKLYDIIVGSEASPADNVFCWLILPTTTSGVSTARTPTPLDAADAASLFVGGQSYSTQPTTSTSTFLRIALNQRATFRWVAAPGSELVTPATTANGIVTQTVVATAVLTTATNLVQEQ